ncbi:MAG: hypothetical protein PQJ45_00305 [Sphaerochaetaceae bacterium]|nr:hypothetical protein [Sphaerochaetaceae bacterium]
MKKQKQTILLLIASLLLIIFNISCSSVFTATISGTVKAEPRNNSSADEQTNLSDANVYVFFNESEWTSYKEQWDSKNEATTKSIITTIKMPSVSDTVRTTTTNTNGGFSIATMWNTPSPLFGKDGDEKNFHIAVYHKDYGMFFDDTEYSVFSDSSQNISFICEYDEKQKVQYSITINTLDYSDNNSEIPLSSVDPKVVIKYSLISEDGDVSNIGEETQSFEDLPTSSTTNATTNTYTFICDKYYWDENDEKYTSEKVYPVGTIYFYDKGAEGEETWRMCDEEGADLSSTGTEFSITSKSTNLSKDIYVDKLNRDYRISFDIDYPTDDDTNDYSGTPPTIQTFSPKTIINVYFDGYNSSTDSIETPNSTIEENELYKTFTYSVDEVPEDGYYTFNLNRMFDEDGNEIFANVTYLLEDDENDEEYIQTNSDGTIINEDNTFDNTLVSYSLDNYSTTVDTYVDRVKLKYTIEFNLEDYEDGSTITLQSEDSATESTFNPTIKLLILPYDGDSTTLSSLDFESASSQTPNDKISNNTFSFDWEKYDSDGNIQYPAVKYFLYDNSNPLYCQVASDDNVEFTHIKDLDSVRKNVDTLAFKKGILNESVDVEMEKLEETYYLNFSLNDIEDNNNEISFTTFDPKVKLNIYKTNTDSENLISTKYYKQANSSGTYSFTWQKYGEDIDLEDLPTTVDTDKVYPIVKYYLFNTDTSSYQMLQDSSTTSPQVVTSIEEAPSTSIFVEGESQKDIDVYIRSKQINFNISFDITNIASDEEISIREINPIVKIYYNDGESDKVDTFNDIPSDGIYQLTVDRTSTSIDTDISVDLEDKRSKVRYRLCSNDPDNSDPSLRYTVDGVDTARYQENFSLTKANDNELQLYVKDYQYPTSISFEGRFIDSDNVDDNGHDVFLIAQYNGEFDEEDYIKLSSPTHTHYMNSTDSYNTSNIENGYFSTTYTQSKIAQKNEYDNSSKYLVQQFKIVVNETKNETNATIDNSDYMSIVDIKNNGTSSTYVYVDTSTTYTN